MPAVVYYESKDPGVYLGGVYPPDSSRMPFGTLKLVPKAFISNVNRIVLFEIILRHGFGVAESWLALRRSQTIDWAKCEMEFQSFPYGWSTGNVFVQPEITQDFGAEEGWCDWPLVVVVWTTSDHSTFEDGQSSTSARFAKYPRPTAVEMPPTYE